MRVNLYTLYFGSVISHCLVLADYPHHFLLLRRRRKARRKASLEAKAGIKKSMEAEKKEDDDSDDDDVDEEEEEDDDDDSDDGHEADSAPSGGYRVKASSAAQKQNYGARLKVNLRKLRADAVNSLATKTEPQPGSSHDTGKARADRLRQRLERKRAEKPKDLEEELEEDRRQSAQPERAEESLYPDSAGVEREPTTAFGIKLEYPNFNGEGSFM